MKFQDPGSVTCEQCNVKSSHAVAESICLGATCPSCGVKLTNIALAMRELSDEWGDFWYLVNFTILLEKILGDKIRDAELEQVKTLCDLARVVQRHLSTSADCDVRSIAFVQEAARETFSNTMGQGSAREAATIALDVRLMDALPRTDGVQGRPNRATHSTKAVEHPRVRN